jgi:DNA-binding MarR family transcriptional regulator
MTASTPYSPSPRTHECARRPKLSGAQIKLLYQLYDEKQRTVKEICGILAISRTAIYKYLERRKVATGPPVGDGA